jgi:cytochrome c biogenesis protein CcmG, thiol:disulfide interchange protein DsbE
MIPKGPGAQASGLFVGGLQVGMKMDKPALSVRALGIILGAAALAALPTASAGEPALAPDFTLTLLTGAQVGSATLRGKVVVLNFWASWCAPCKRELAELEAAALRYGPEHVAVFAINAEHPADPHMLARQATAMRIPVATAVSGGYRPRNNAVPTTFVIDAQGRLVLVKGGAFKPGEIDALFASLPGLGK